MIHVFFFSHKDAKDRVNPKSEYRNPKQIPNPKPETSRISNRIELIKQIHSEIVSVVFLCIPSAQSDKFAYLGYFQ
jgi:hypothetical protein